MRENAEHQAIVPLFILFMWEHAENQDKIPLFVMSMRENAEHQAIVPLFMEDILHLKSESQVSYLCLVILFMIEQLQ
jgi:hypothetical protein